MPPHATFSTRTPPGIHKSNKIFAPATGSILPHVLLLVSLPVAFASPPFPGRTLLFLSIIVGLALATQFDPHFSNDPGAAQPFSQSWSVWFAALEKLFTASRSAKHGGKPVIGPESLFWRNKRGVREAEDLAGFGPAKLIWALGLLFNLRGANWNYQVKNVPELSATERKSRKHFLASRAFKTTYYFIMADVVNNLWIQLYYVGKDGSSYTAVGAVDSKFLTIKDADWTWRLVKTLIWGPLPYYLISFQYNLLSLVAVATTLSDAEDWPPLFGYISHVTSVRNFWGQFWHQMIRRASPTSPPTLINLTRAQNFNTFTGYIIDTLHIPRGTVWSSQIQNWLAFFITSMFHAQCNLITPVPSNIEFRERVDGMFKFFLWQALAISTEDTVKGIWKMACTRLGIRRGSRALGTFEASFGRLWVCASMWISMPWAADLTLRFRFGDELMVPFSVLASRVERVVRALRQ